MRPSRIHAVLLVVCVFFLVASAQDNWKGFVYLEDGFSITLPVSPQFKTSVLDSAIGKLEVHTYSLDLGSDRGFAMNVIDYKTKTEPTPEKIKEILQIAKNGAINDMGGKLTVENEVELSGHKGIDFTSESGAYHLHSRFYFVGSKLYTLMTISPVKLPIASEADRIFDSLRFL
jgi:hypothetical protein